MGAQLNSLFPFLIVLVLMPGTEMSAEKLKPEDVIQRHLESLGSPETIAARTSLKAEGRVLFEVVVGGSGQLQGPSTFICDGEKLRLSMVFEANEYPGEDVAFDGDSVAVGYLQPGVRSAMGQFFSQFDEIVSEGLLGGALSTGWCLRRMDTLQPKLNYEGLKELDGTRYHTIRYQRRKGSDVQIRLYFDTETYRHRRSIYRVKITSPIIGSRDSDSATQPETWHTLKESFDNFHDIRNLTLPTRWTIEYTKDIGTTGSVLRFTTQYTDMFPNAEIPASEFKIH